MGSDHGASGRTCTRPVRVVVVSLAFLALSVFVARGDTQDVADGRLRGGDEITKHRRLQYSSPRRRSTYTQPQPTCTPDFSCPGAIIKANPQMITCASYTCYPSDCCTPCSAGKYKDPSTQSAAPCSECDVGKYAPPFSLVCCPNGTMARSATSPVCEACPFPDRCAYGRCIANSQGPSCASCVNNSYLAPGAVCVMCPESEIILLLTTIIAMIAAGILVGLVWSLALVENQSISDAAAEGKIVAKSVGNAISVGAIYGSIGFQHLHLSFLTFVLPFGWPEVCCMTFPQPLPAQCALTPNTRAVP